MRTDGKGVFLRKHDKDNFDIPLSEKNFNELKYKVRCNIANLTYKHMKAYIDTENEKPHDFPFHVFWTKIPMRRWFSAQEIYDVNGPFLKTRFNDALLALEKDGEIQFNKYYKMWRLIQ